MKSTQGSSIKTWLIEYPVQNKLECHEIKGQTLHQALTSYWTQTFSGFGNQELKFTVHFFFGNEAWCSIQTKNNDPLAYRHYGSYRIINVLAGDRSGYRTQDQLTKTQLEERKQLYQRSFQVSR